MDIDMHYYGTYALARAAGIKPDVALRIATAAEFVDDSTDTEIIVNPQGARFRGESTAHHPSDFAPNNDRDDQLLVWLPFHFLPGNEGTTQTQRLVCRKNSKIAQEMVAHHLELSDRIFAAEMIGITAHVYADTFAHYGFSGVSSRANRVDSLSITLVNGAPLTGRLERFMGKFGLQGGLMKNFRDAVTAAASAGAEDTTGALGHGAVATFPDQPYLEWSYSYQFPDVVGSNQRIARQNAGDYLEGAQFLHAMFLEFAKRRPDYVDAKGPLSFDKIEGTVDQIFKTVLDCDGRIALWKKALADGKLSAEPDATLIDYDHQSWRNQVAKLATFPEPEMASGVPVYHFYTAAALHQYYILRDLLPRYGIYVI